MHPVSYEFIVATFAAAAFAALLHLLLLHLLLLHLLLLLLAGGKENSGLCVISADGAAFAAAAALPSSFPAVVFAAPFPVSFK